MALRIRATSPVYCGKCGQRRGLAHVCLVRRPGGRTRVKAPGVSLIHCDRCGQDYANPLTHTCAPRSDFKRRKAAAARAERRRKAEQLREQRRQERARRRAQGGPSRSAQHRYETCRDEDCRRMTCRVYREGYDNGYEAARAMAGAGGGR